MNTIYFVLIDRFYNADPANDGSVRLSDPVSFHGGDLSGVREKIPWIQDLGFDTVWISPTWEMRTEPFFGHAAFHGYWVRNPAVIEPRFGTVEELRRLRDALNLRGMKLVLDMVYNHVSFDAPLRVEHPEWFHEARAIEDWSDPEQVIGREVHGLPDLAQERPEVRSWIGEWTRQWIREVRPDGFRIDAVRHMPADFLAELSAAVKQQAGEGFWLLGEIFEGDPVRVEQQRQAAGLDAVFDFPLHYAMIDVFCRGRHPGRIAATLSLDGLFTDPESRVTFLDNHDVPRVLSACGGDSAKVDAALDLLLTLRGVPSVYYGTESGLAGQSELENRRDMRFTLTPTGERLRARLAWRKEGGKLWSRGRTEVMELTPAHLLLRRTCGPAEGCPAPREGRISVDIDAAGRASVAAAEVPTAWDGAQARRHLGVYLRLIDPPAGEVRVVGAPPALGAWDPGRGLPISAAPAALQLDAGTVAAFKLVRRAAPDQPWEWETGEDRYLLVDRSMLQTLRWGERDG